MSLCPTFMLFGGHRGQKKAMRSPGVRVKGDCELPEMSSQAGCNISSTHPHSKFLSFHMDS